MRNKFLMFGRGDVVMRFPVTLKKTNEAGPDNCITIRWHLCKYEAMPFSTAYFPI